MKNHQIEQLTEVLDASFRENSNPQGYALFHQLILLLAEGRAVSPARIAEALRRSPKRSKPSCAKCQALRLMKMEMSSARA